MADGSTTPEEFIIDWSVMGRSDTIYMIIEKELQTDEGQERL